MSGYNVDIDRHTRYLKYVTTLLPAKAASHEGTLVVISYFSLTTLEIMSRFDTLYNDDVKAKMLDYVYSLQVKPGVDGVNGNAGFRGSNFFGGEYDCSGDHFEHVHELDFAHITTTAMCLILLIMLGDEDLSRVDKEGILQGLKACQNPDGSFSYISAGSENDLRFIYSACVACYILNDWGDIDTEAIFQYIISCQRYDYGFAMNPGCESHASAAYLAVASLWLLGRLDELPNREELIKWLADCQLFGFCGRPNKLEDSCYSFWVGGAFQLLGVYDEIVNTNLAKSFVLGCEQETGGFAKWTDSNSDPYHTHHSICGLSFMGDESLNLKPVHAAFGISLDVFNKIQHRITATQTP